MGGLNAALNSGRTSLQTNQKAIEITGLNVANVNTEGYSRQTPHLTPYPALAFGDFFIGTGVTVGSVQRSHDVFLAGQIKDKSMEFGLENSMLNPLAELERVIGIGEGSLSDEFDQFFDAWRQLSTNPGGEVERQAVLQRGELIGRAFSNIYREIQQSVKNVNSTITSKVDGVNLALEEVAQLNTRISALEMSGQDANSDRDRRDVLLKSLATSIGATTFETSTGAASVQLPNGMPLVEMGKANQINAVFSGTDVNLELSFGASTLPLDRNALGGEFRGLYEVRDVMIPDVVNRLDQLAYSFATEVNAMHVSGSGLEPNPTSNLSFFEPPSSHVSQSYPAIGNFGNGQIVLTVGNGEPTIITGLNSLEDIIGAINDPDDGIAGITAEINSNNQLVIRSVSGANVKIDASGLAGGTYAPPTFSSQDYSSNLKLAISETKQIAAGTGSAPGDNTNALAILLLEQKQTLGNDTFVSFYGKIASAVGVEAARNRQAAQGFKDSLVQLENMRDGVDGVSLEEEMINLLKYQRGFEASARFLSTVDEMMATLMTLKR
ncbi:flagellar hook-associated protein FlgK [Pelovirga terrestris]|uniref:Flagellar hook-associated protein 1 n=1 Tax=Pelovirga terrestris TaxID=2771352 RepID=A0A8J6ULJ1_9BACT|nr:flagellar hook-associated protein FlgK [Pelovirga terrestris]MBD1401252.1 flagellar hook-associated protein FlgK [Pelovirga terrestris]